MCHRHVSPVQLQPKADSPVLSLKTEVGQSQTTDDQNSMCFLHALNSILYALTVLHFAAQAEGIVEAKFQKTGVKRGKLLEN